MKKIVLFHLLLLFSVSSYGNDEVAGAEGSNDVGKPYELRLLREQPTTAQGGSLGKGDGGVEGLPDAGINQKSLPIFMDPNVLGEWCEETDDGLGVRMEILENGNITSEGRLAGQVVPRPGRDGNRRYRLFKNYDQGSDFKLGQFNELGKILPQEDGKLVFRLIIPSTLRGELRGKSEKQTKEQEGDRVFIRCEALSA